MCIRDRAGVQLVDMIYLRKRRAQKGSEEENCDRKDKESTTVWEKEKKTVSKTDCNKYCNRQLKKEYEWLKEVDKFALTNAIYNMDAAYQKFFKEHAGYPKFKSKHDNHKSYTCLLYTSRCV